ncbi:MAG: Rap1a/Tai family immunity protein [Acidiferrobacterales bacterium]
MTQTKRIIVKYLKKNANSLDKDAVELIFRALEDAWPCGGSS